MLTVGDVKTIVKIIDENDYDLNKTLAQVTWFPTVVYDYMFHKYNRPFDWLDSSDISKQEFFKEKICWIIYNLLINPAAEIEEDIVRPEILTAMAESSYLVLKEIAAKNINTPPDVLASLVLTTFNITVCQAAIANPSLSPNALESLYQKVKHYASNKRGKLLCAIVSNPNCPQEIILDLVMDEDVDVSKRAQEKLATICEKGEINNVFCCGPGYPGFRKGAAAGSTLDSM